MTPMRIIVFGFGASDLVGAVAGKHGAWSLQQDLEVEPERPRLRILEVETDHVVKPQPAAPVHLPEAGDPRLDFQEASTVPDVVALELIGDRGAWPDE